MVHTREYFVSLQNVEFISWKLYKILGWMKTKLDEKSKWKGDLGVVTTRKHISKRDDGIDVHLLFHLDPKSCYALRSENKSNCPCKLFQIHTTRFPFSFSVFVFVTHHLLTLHAQLHYNFVCFNNKTNWHIFWTSSDKMMLSSKLNLFQFWTCLTSNLLTSKIQPECVVLNSVVMNTKL